MTNGISLMPGLSWTAGPPPGTTPSGGFSLRDGAEEAGGAASTGPLVAQGQDSPTEGQKRAACQTLYRELETASGSMDFLAGQDDEALRGMSELGRMTVERARLLVQVLESPQCSTGQLTADQERRVKEIKEQLGELERRLMFEGGAQPAPAPAPVPTDDNGFWDFVGGLLRGLLSIPGRIWRHAY